MKLPKCGSRLTPFIFNTPDRLIADAHMTIEVYPGSYDDGYHASLDASWQVDLFGRQAQTLKAASEDLAQNEEKFYGAQVSLAAEVATAYVALRSAEAELVVVRRSLGTRHETVQLTQWREQSGAGSGLDTQQSISAFEQARASIPELQLTIAQTRNQLTRLGGLAAFGTTGALLGPLLVRLCVESMAIISEGKNGYPQYRTSC